MNTCLSLDYYPLNNHIYLYHGKYIIVYYEKLNIFPSRKKIFLSIIHYQLVE